MAVRQYTFNLTTTPTALNLGTFDRHSASPVTIVFNTDKLNNDTTMIGDANVSATLFGFHLDADKSMTISSVYPSDGEGFYARAKTSTSILHVLVVD